MEGVMVSILDVKSYIFSVKDDKPEMGADTRKSPNLAEGDKEISI